MKSLKEFKPLLKLIGNYKYKLLFASILIFVSELLEILTGYLNGSAIEAITNLDVIKALIFLGIYFCVLIISDCIISNVSSAMLRNIENELTRKLGFNTYKKALNLPAYAYEKMSSGEVINRITNDSTTLSSTFEQLLYMFSSMIGSVIVLVYTFINSWIIGVEIIIFLIILYFILKKYNPILKDVNKQMSHEKDDIVSLVNESVRGIREIKTLGIKQNVISDLSSAFKELFKKSKDEISIKKKFRIINRFLKSILEVGVFISCVILLYYGQITLTFFIAMTYYVYRFMWLLQNINDFSQTYQKVIVSLTRVNELLENRLYDDEKFGDKTISNVNGVIEFKNVCFSYPDEELILDNFSLKLVPNKKIAIVGKSGQGKTTLFNLLTRVFDPTSGVITLDDIDIKKLKESELRKNISIIRQEPFIFNRTILDNFKLLDKNITLEQVRQYAKQAYLDDYIMSLPNQYDTLLGEGGVNLSGGQKQRLSIARTLAKESKVILFDEATSSLDNNSQEYIKKSIDNLVKDHTVIIVAHRLSTIIDADIIYVVDDGCVVASGTHKELLKTNKIYKKLYENESDIK